MTQDQIYTWLVDRLENDTNDIYESAAAVLMDQSRQHGGGRMAEAHQSVG